MAYVRKHKPIRSITTGEWKIKPPKSKKVGRPKTKVKKVTQKLIDRVARTFQLWVRLRDSDSNGYGKCSTCWVIEHYTKMDAWHFLSRKYKNTLLNEQNVNLQCKKCNSPWGWSGEQYKMSLFIDNKYWLGTSNKLLLEAQIVKKFEYEELIAIENDYKERIKLISK